MNMCKLLSISLGFLVIGQNLYSSEESKLTLTRKPSFDGLRDLPSVAAYLYFGNDQSKIARETFNGALNNEKHPHYQRPFGIGHDTQATERWNKSGFIESISTAQDAQSFLNLIQGRSDLTFPETQLERVTSIITQHQREEYNKLKAATSNLANSMKNLAEDSEEKINATKKLQEGLAKLRQYKADHNKKFPQHIIN